MSILFRDTLQLWTQIVGKVRMMNEPLVNHWWNFRSHVLDIIIASGRHCALDLRPVAVADFYRELMGALDKLGVGCLRVKGRG
jgi:hypothetical protein